MAPIDFSRLRERVPAGKRLDGLEALEWIVELRRQLDELEAQAVAEARDADATWEQVAWRLDVSRQAAHRKHASRLARPKEGHEPIQGGGG